MWHSVLPEDFQTYEAPLGRRLGSSYLIQPLLVSLFYFSPNSYISQNNIRIKQSRNHFKYEVVSCSYVIRKNIMQNKQNNTIQGQNNKIYLCNFLSHCSKTACCSQETQSLHTWLQHQHLMVHTSKTNAR